MLVIDVASLLIGMVAGGFIVYAVMQKGRK
ncbi:hypothetical protein [Lactobacillus phage Sabazios]|nr:hypothetical protein [Lactobacillus phage Silenus]AYH91860.1 hypothetical protein [Lactobacillus phage Sabazios]